jgi:prepilin-type processing-associated H-X9-DG protein
VDEHTTNDGFFYTYGATSTDHLTSTHNGGGNLLFCDGHVKFYSLDQYPLKDSTIDSSAIALKTSMTLTPRFYDQSFGPNGYYEPTPALFGTCKAP